MPLTPPSQFPPTYGDADDASIDDGAPYSTTAWSALLDGVYRRIVNGARGRGAGLPSYLV